MKPAFEINEMGEKKFSEKFKTFFLNECSTNKREELIHEMMKSLGFIWMASEQYFVFAEGENKGSIIVVPFLSYDEPLMSKVSLKIQIFRADIGRLIIEDQDTALATCYHTCFIGNIGNQWLTLPKVIRETWREAKN